MAARPVAAPPPVPNRPSLWPPAMAGLLAMLALMGLQEALNSIDQTFISAPSAAAQTIVRLTPSAVTSAMIAALGKDALRLLIAGAYIGTALIGLLLGLVAGRLRAAGRGWPAIAGLLVGAPWLLYLLVAPSQARGAGQLALAAGLGALLATLYAGLTLLLWRALAPATASAASAPFGAPAEPGRRALLGGGLGLVGLLAGGGALLRGRLRDQSTAEAALTPLEALPTAIPAATANPTALPATAPTATAIASPIAAAPPTTAAPPIPAVPATAAVTGATAAPATVAARATAEPKPSTPSSTVAPDPPAAPSPTPTPSLEQLEDEYFAGVRGLVPEVTPIERFYVVDEAIDDPRIDLGRWRLTVTGHVERPLVLTFGELRALPFVDQHATLMCISYEPGQDLISSGMWRGVRLADLLQRAGLRPGATEVILRSVDAYDEAHPIARALEPTTLLAYGMNDVLLPRQHGAPLRAIVPGHYGYKHVKWLTEIEVTNAAPHRGYWERSAGWSQPGRLAGALSRIDTIDSPPVTVGGLVKVGGIAFAGPRGISRVEVSDDGGRTWVLVRLKRPLSPLTWRLWAFDWRPTRAGRAGLLVRAYESDGTPQIARPRPSHPDGSTGLHGFDYDVAP